MCDIRGLGIQPGLSANGFDWGRVRIDRPAHQIPPYDTRKGGAQPTAIVVENTGTEEVRVESINILELNPGDQKHFILPNGLKTGFSLQPGETRLYEAFCQPAETGEHQITITYNNTANSQAKSILKCIGILPKLETQDVDFGTTLVKTSPVDKEKIKVTKRVAFKNLNYEWEDSVTITNLQTFPNPGDISNVINIFGIEGFRYDKGAITFPIKLAPGESIEFQSEFAAMKNGDASASLVTVSDAEAEVESKWTGFGITKSITGTGGNVTTCVGVPAMINCEVENTGSDDLVISSVYFDPPVSSMNLDKPSDAQGFTLPPGEKRTISIDYLPLDEEDITTELFFGNDSEDSLFSVNVSGSTVYFRRTTLMNPNEQFVSIGGRAKVDIVLNNEEGNDMTKADVQRLDLVVTYNRAFLGTDPDKIVPGSAVQNGFTIEDLKIDQDNGVILFSLVSDGNAILNQEGVLARITFDAYLPVTNETESVVKTTISAPGNTCIEIDSSSSRIILNRICVLNLRLVNNLYRNYELGMIRPNPAGSEGANLSFSVAMDGWVNIRIIDVTGQLAATLVSDILKMGEYEIPLPVENISSGVYQVEMRSGDFRQTRSLIICK